MIQEHEFDVVVIGTGPGGEGAAMQAVKFGRRVAVVERSPRIGGNCTHKGTIPSKALRFTIYQIANAVDSKAFGDLRITSEIRFGDLLRRARTVIDKQVTMRLGFYDRNNVPVFEGHARFLDPHTVEVRSASDGRVRLQGKHFVLATGSRPFRPGDIDFSHKRVFDSDTIFELEETPQSMSIYGAGVIGCEYASMFRNLGVKVNLINTREKLLEFLDDEIIDALSYHLRDRGVLIRHRESYSRVEPQDDGVVVHLKSGKQIKTDILLWAAGRAGNSDEMSLPEIDIVPDSRGQIPVNEHFQTVQPHIYAVGDVIGRPGLASAAYVQGRYAGQHATTGEAERALIADIPTGIYTSPEISSLGKSERELTDAGVPYEVGHSIFKSLARAQITGQTTGMLKILFHRETLQILGIHCFGMNAAEIIHIGQAIMSQPGELNTLRYFVNQTFNYPTMAEAYRVAALNGLNRLF
ncbi:MAG: Si-specific NAD(P)(+) transhydrogenase [Planctomycetaceae bacterium]|nr:Si-specific NAD(P)(+) transhydrogenase [Planctomycetaceae bacterium]